MPTDSTAAVSRLLLAMSEVDPAKIERAIKIIHAEVEFRNRAETELSDAPAAAALSCRPDGVASTGSDTMRWAKGDPTSVLAAQPLRQPPYPQQSVRSPNLP